MATENQSRREAELYQEIYKNAKMGASSLTDLMSRVDGEELKTELGVELAQYEEIAHKAQQALFDMGVKPKEEGLMTRMSAKAGVMMNTMVDATSSHIAQMVIEGSTMGTTDMIRKLNEYKCEVGDGARGSAAELAKRTIDFEQDCVEKMKAYL